MEHKRVLSSERPYVCQVCQKRFTQKAHLVIHRRTHTGEKPYACHICHKRFAQSSHLNNHKRIHTGEKPYFCNVCNLGFSRKQRLELHVLQHAQQKNINSQQQQQQQLNNNNNNNDDVNSTNNIDNKSVPFTSEAEAAYPRPLLDSTQSQAQISAGIGDPGIQAMNFSHRRKPAFVTRVSNEDYEIMQNNFESQTVPDHDDGSFSLSSLTSAHHSSLMKSEPKEFDEFEAITHELEAIAHPNINQVMSSENLVVRQVDPLDQDENEQPKSLEDSLVMHLDGTSHSEVLRDVHSSTEPDVGVMCAVSTTDIHHAQAADDGDSITSESNNSNGEQSIPNRAPKRSILGHHSVKISKSLNSQSHLNRQRSLINNRTSTVSTSSSYSRINNRVCLVDFSTEELITHLMSRDDVYRCDFCCLIFQDAAMYHLHRSMHDKMDCRCCNICGKLSKDKHDFIAHFLTEHK